LGAARTHRVAILVGLITLVGLVLRLIQFEQSLVGDELSTLWIVDNNGLAGTLRVVASDAEITPPLSFILSWFAHQFGSAPELVRLPSLIVGTASIPLLYDLGRRTVGRNAGLVAAAVFALSPLMTSFAANGRAYALLVFFLLLSTIAMLKACETGSRWWWVAYGLASCLAMYTHYTAAFVLIAQLVWVLWLVPKGRIPALLANVGAAVLFVPWLPNLFKDFESPTTVVLAGLQGSGFTAKRINVEQWAFGNPIIDPKQMPGLFLMGLITIGLLIGTFFSIRAFRNRRPPASAAGNEAWVVPHSLVLILAIAVATFVGEVITGLAGTDLLGARNMTASWYGLALAIGALVTIPGGTVAIVCTVLVLGGYGLASAKLLRPENSVVDFKGPARVIDAESGPGDIVVDIFAAITTPVPTTPLDIQLEAELPTYNLNLPNTPPPFLPNSDTVILPPEDEISEAFSEARGHTVFMLVPDLLTVEDADTSGRKLKDPLLIGRSVLLPENATITDIQSFDGTIRPNLYTIEVE